VREGVVVALDDDVAEESVGLSVRFVDGTEGQVEMEAFLQDPRIDGTVFEPLREPIVFAQAEVVLGAVQWPNGADLAPDTMHDEICRHGKWVVDAD
jgi:hypothetical protein